MTVLPHLPIATAARRVYSHHRLHREAEGLLPRGRHGRQCGVTGFRNRNGPIAGPSSQSLGQDCDQQSWPSFKGYCDELYHKCPSPSCSTL